MRSTDCVQVFVPVVCSFSGINVIMLCFKSYSKSYLALRFCLIKLNLVKKNFLPLKKNKTNRISPNYFENYLKAFITHEIKKKREDCYSKGNSHFIRRWLQTFTACLPNSFLFSLYSAAALHFFHNDH